jgi:hypothetical protein
MTEVLKIALDRWNTVYYLAFGHIQFYQCMYVCQSYIWFPPNDLSSPKAIHLSFDAQGQGP